MPFEAGNKAAQKPKLWADALNRAIKQDDGKRVRDAAEKLLSLAAEGEAWAIKELADRLDGKPVQATEISGAGGDLLTIAIRHFDAGDHPPK